MANKNFLNKPFFLGLMTNLVFICALFIASPVSNDFGQFLLILIILFGFSLYVGKSHAKNFKEAMSQKDKIKISLYYFLFWFLSISSVVILMVMNTTVKGLPLFSLNKVKTLLFIFFINFLLFGANSLCIYYALSLGCKLELSKINSSNSQESEPPS